MKFKSNSNGNNSNIYDTTGEIAGSSEKPLMIKKANASKMYCFNCDQRGHKKYKCPQLRNKISNGYSVSKGHKEGRHLDKDLQDVEVSQKYRDPDNKDLMKDLQTYEIDDSNARTVFKLSDHTRIDEIQRSDSDNSTVGNDNCEPMTFRIGPITFERIHGSD